MKPDPNGDDEKPKVITSRTMIPLGTVAAVLLVLFSAQQWLSSRLNSIDNKLEGLKDVWTVQDQQVFILKLDKLNPAVKVPDISEIRVARHQ